MSLSEESEELLGKVRQALEAAERPYGPCSCSLVYAQEVERLRLALQDAERRVKQLEEHAAQRESVVKRYRELMGDMTDGDVPAAMRSYDEKRVPGCVPSSQCVHPAVCSSRLRVEERCVHCRQTSGVRAEAMGRDGW